MSYLFVHSDVSYGFTFLYHTSNEKVGHKQEQAKGGARGDERKNVNESM